MPRKPVPTYPDPPPCCRGAIQQAAPQRSPPPVLTPPTARIYTIEAERSATRDLQQRPVRGDRTLPRTPTAAAPAAAAAQSLRAPATLPRRGLRATALATDRVAVPSPLARTSAAASVLGPGGPRLGSPAVGVSAMRRQFPGVSSETPGGASSTASTPNGMTSRMATLLRKSTAVRNLIRRELDHSRAPPIRPPNFSTTVAEEAPAGAAQGPCPASPVVSVGDLSNLLATPEATDGEHDWDVREPLYEMRPRGHADGGTPNATQRKLLAAAALQSAMHDAIQHLQQLDWKLADLKNAGGPLDTPVKRLLTEIDNTAAHIDGLEAQLVEMYGCGVLDRATPSPEQVVQPVAPGVCTAETAASPIRATVTAHEAALEAEVAELRRRLAREEEQKEQLLHRVIHMRQRDMQTEHPSRRSNLLRRAATALSGVTRRNTHHR